MTDRPAHIKDKTKVEHEVSDDAYKALLKQFIELKDEKDDLEKRLKEINQALDGHEDKETQVVHEGLHAKLFAWMESKGFDLVRINGLGSFWPKPENYPSVNTDEKPALFEWLDAAGMGAIAKRDINWQTLKGWVNDRLAENKPLPPMVNVAIKMKIGFRRAK